MKLTGRKKIISGILADGSFSYKYLELYGFANGHAGYARIVNE